MKRVLFVGGPLDHILMTMGDEFMRTHHQYVYTCYEETKVTRSKALSHLRLGEYFEVKYHVYHFEKFRLLDKRDITIGRYESLSKDEVMVKIFESYIRKFEGDESYKQGDIVENECTV